MTSEEIRRASTSIIRKQCLENFQLSEDAVILKGVSIASANKLLVGYAISMNQCDEILSELALRSGT